MKPVMMFLSLVAVSGIAAAGDVGELKVNTRGGDPSIARKPVMISVLRGGNVVEQQEIALGEIRTNINVEPGIYEIRLEGEGMKTLVKRGIHVNAGKATDVLAPMSAGKGVSIVEYAEGGLSREEIASRLSRLESTVAALKVKVQRAEPTNGKTTGAEPTNAEPTNAEPT